MCDHGSELYIAQRWLNVMMIKRRKKSSVPDGVVAVPHNG